MTAAPTSKGPIGVQISQPRNQDAGARASAKQLQIGVQLHQSGQHDEAAKVYSDILLEQPAYPDALHLLGLVEAERGRVDEAFSHWVRANRIAVETHCDAANPDLFLNEVVALQQLYDPSIVQSFTRVSPESQQRESEQLRVFIAGFPRSGTSLMHHRLSQTPGVTGLHEPRTMHAVKGTMK